MMANATKRLMAVWLTVALGGFAALVLPTSSAQAACCISSCPSPSITACTSIGCPTDVVPNCPGQIVAETPDAVATCGAGTYSSCPTQEYGAACTDGVNNDAWLDAFTDCADSDCRNHPACCGGAGQPCCQDAPCIAPIIGECDDPGLVCVPGAGPERECVACGGIGEPCCMSEEGGSVVGTCETGLLCNGMTAEANGTCTSLGTAPVLSPYALALGSLLLLAMGAWRMRRRAIR